MKRSPLLWSPAILPALASACIVAFIVLLPLAAWPTSLWRGYYTLMVREGSDAQRRAGNLSGRLSWNWPIVSRDTASVLFNDFSSLERVEISEIASRLDPADPRYDPYLKGIAAYFSPTGTQEGWQLLYVPSRGSVLSLFFRLTLLMGLPGARTWRLLDLDLIKAAVSLVCSACCAVLFSIQLVKKRRYLSILAFLFVLAWLPMLFSGGAGVLCVFLVLSLTWFPLLGDCARYAEEASSRDSRWKNTTSGEIAEKLFRFFMIASILPAAYCLLLGRSPRIVYAFVGAVLPSMLLLVVPFPLQRIRKAKKRRSKARDGMLHGFSAALLAIAVLGSAAVVALQVFRYSGLPATRAEARSPGIRWDWLHAEGQGVGDGSLPSFAGAVAHAAFLEGFQYGREFGMPREGERVVLREFDAVPGTAALRERSVTVAEFDSAWLLEVAARAQPGSLERMLLDQGGLVGVSAAGSSQVFLREGLFSLVLIIVIAAGASGDRVHGPLISGDFWRFNFKPRKTKGRRGAGGVSY